MYTFPVYISVTISGFSKSLSEAPRLSNLWIRRACVGETLDDSVLEASVDWVGLATAVKVWFGDRSKSVGIDVVRTGIGESVVNISKLA